MGVRLTTYRRTTCCRTTCRRHGGSGTLALIAVALTAALLAGCAGGSGGSVEPGGSVSASQPPPRSTPPSATAAQLTVSGEVVEGVEAGCLLLRTSSGEYLLVIPRSMDRSVVRAGARLEVRGRLQPGLVSYCQQGTPLLVSEIRPG